MNEVLAVLLANAVLVLPIAALAWIATRARRPAVAHVLWVLLLIKLLTPPLISPELVVDPQRYPALAAILPDAEGSRRSVDSAQQPAGDLAESSAAPSTRSSVPEQPTSAALPSPAVAARSAAEYGILSLLVIWCGGSLYWLVVFASRIRLAVRLVRSSGRQDSMASALAETLFEQNWRAPPRVILVDAVISPTLIGIGPWTRILYPRRLWRELPSQQRTSLLVHELEHFRRCDHWVRVLEAAATVVFWWHPAVWWARRQIEINEELCCDAVAAGRCEELPYAEALLTTLDFINEPSWSPATPVGTGVSRVLVLEQRLRQIMDRSLSGRLSLVGRAMLLLFAFAALPIQPWLFGGRIASSSSFTLASISSVPPEPFIQPTRPAVPLPEPTVDVASLPPAPTGWWSKRPVGSWAHYAGDDPRSTRLVVNATGTAYLEGGIVQGGRHDLSEQRITSAAFWKSSTRLVTGDADGNVRLWDVASGEPVSWLGRHRSAITSLTISVDGTLITGAEDGTCFAWDLQSGVRRASWTANENPIQSVRLYDNGRRAVVIASDWREKASRIVVLDAENLEPLFDTVMKGETLATTRADQGQLTFVDWSGRLLRLNDEGVLQSVGTTEKDFVTAFVFSQDAALKYSASAPMEQTADPYLIRS